MVVDSMKIHPHETPASRGYMVSTVNPLCRPSGLRTAAGFHHRLPYGLSIRSPSSVTRSTESTREATHRIRRWKLFVLAVPWTAADSRQFFPRAQVLPRS